MNRGIEEIKKLAETLRLIDDIQFDPNYTLSYQRAICLNKAGYRKSTDVAREIFEEIETSLSILKGGDVYYAIRAEDYFHCKRKYESEGVDDGNG